MENVHRMPGVLGAAHAAGAPARMAASIAAFARRVARSLWDDEGRVEQLRKIKDAALDKSRCYVGQ